MAKENGIARSAYPVFLCQAPPYGVMKRFDYVRLWSPRRFQAASEKSMPDSAAMAGAA